MLLCHYNISLLDCEQSERDGVDTFTNNTSFVCPMNRGGLDLGNFRSGFHLILKVVLYNLFQYYEIR